MRTSLAAEACCPQGQRPMENTAIFQGTSHTTPCPLLPLVASDAPGASDPDSMLSDINFSNHGWVNFQQAGEASQTMDGTDLLEASDPTTPFSETDLSHQGWLQFQVPQINQDGGLSGSSYSYHPRRHMGE